MNLVERLRAWAHPFARKGEYSPIGVTFHWTMAGLVSVQLWLGWHTSRMPVGHDKVEAYQLHAQLGLIVLALAVLRMLYRAFVPGPVNDADKPGWQTVAAHLTHVAFYLLFVGLPLTGWAMLSATGTTLELRLLGMPWPHMPFETLSPGLRQRIEDWAGWGHWLMVWAMVLLVVAHIGAALKHYLIDRDDVLPGMLPVLDPPEEKG